MGYLHKIRQSRPTKLVLGLRSLPKTIDRLEATNEELMLQNNELKTNLNDINNAISTLYKVFEDQRDEVKEQHNRIRSVDVRTSDLSHQFGSMEKTLSQYKKSGASVKDTSSAKNLQADDHVLDNFYVLFENHFRGEQKDIRKRQEYYLPYFIKNEIESQQFPVLDIGCGRGEFIEVLADNSIRGIGLDLNEEMIEIVKAKGFEGVQQDALSYLQSQKPDTFMAITGFHIIEHIPFSDLLRIFAECYRVLKPGGFVIFETPNPENTTVGSCNFYIDPSHLHPLPPAVTEFALSTRGFAKAKILRLHPMDRKIAHEDQQVKFLLEKFLGPQDYSVIAYKA